MKIYGLGSGRYKILEAGLQAKPRGCGKRLLESTVKQGRCYGLQ